MASQPHTSANSQFGHPRSQTNDGDVSEREGYAGYRVSDDYDSTGDVNHSFPPEGNRQHNVPVAHKGNQGTQGGVLQTEGQ